MYKRRHVKTDLKINDKYSQVKIHNDNQYLFKVNKLIQSYVKEKAALD